MKILIFAGGKDRPDWWHLDMRRVCVPICRRPLVVYTQEQLVRLGHKPVVVSQYPDVQKLAIGGRFFDQGETRSYSEAILATQGLWEDETTILHGDAIFSDRAMSYVLGTKEAQDRNELPCFYGPVTGEVLAFRFGQEHNDRIVAAASYCRNVLDDKEEWKFKSLASPTGGPTNCEAFYLSLGETDKRGRSLHNLHSRLGTDWMTADFDYSERYLKWMEEKHHKWASRPVLPDPPK